MKTLIFTLITAFTICSFQEAQSQEKDWTLLVYLVGSDLESGFGAGTTDIQEMLDAGTTDYVNVVVLTGGADKDGWRTPKTWLINSGVKTELSFVPTNTTNMADPQTITEFINWGTTNYPAQSYMLDFWNHGSDIRGYGSDKVSGKNFSIAQITSGIATSSFITGGKKFDIIGFDACLMASLEVQSSLQDFAYYYVGSEEQEPGHGWDYTPIVQAMESGENLEGDKIGKFIVEGFRDQGLEEGTTAVTLACTDLYYIQDIESTLVDLFSKIKAQNKIGVLQRARAKSQEFSLSAQNPILSEDMVDIADLMKKIILEDNSLAPEANAVLGYVNQAVLHNTTDATRPHANGIAMYIPHNVLPHSGERNWVLNENYALINFNSDIKTFIKDDYVTAALSDNSPPSGTHDGDFNGRLSESADEYSALRIDHDDDLEQVQIVLIEEFEGFPNEYILLGATHADTMVLNDDGTETYAYHWDEHWIGINGHPAYITDIHDYHVIDSLGNTEYFTRIHIPAAVNVGLETEQDVILSYRYDADFNYVLESIIPEPTGDGEADKELPKARVFLQPGDQVQLIYEVFNEVTDEEYFIIDNAAIINITTGNSDLKLEYDQLEEGDYHIGYVLMDHSQNDTIIFDPSVYSVVATSVTTDFASNGIELYPNPANQHVIIENKNFKGESYTVKVFDQSGRKYLDQNYTNQNISINTAKIPSGLYIIEIIQGREIYSDKLIIKH